MHDEILNHQQKELLPLLSKFKREYYLVGDTAIALHIGHRRSIDFDMFKQSAINHKRNLDKIISSGFSPSVTRRVVEQMNLIGNCSPIVRVDCEAIAKSDNQLLSFLIAQECIITAQ